jgi:hypothetical protein
MMAKKNDAILGSFFLFIGIGVTLESLRYHLGTARQPLPGLLPFLAGLILVGLSAMLIFRPGKDEDAKSPSLSNLRRPAQLILGLVIYISISSFVGYILATTILSIFILLAMETKRWRVIIVSSLAVALGSYIVFKLLLGLPLPGGSILRLG